MVLKITTGRIIVRLLSFGLFLCTSCIPLNYKPVIHCDNKLKATESQLHKALDNFFKLYQNNIVKPEMIQPISDTAFFRKYYGFKVSEITDSIYNLNLMRVYYKVNVIPPGNKPRYNYTVTSDDKRMMFSFSVSNCLVEMKHNYALPEDNICQLCLDGVTIRSNSNNFKSGSSSKLTNKERKQAKIVFENDILSKIKRILEEKGKG